MLADRNTIGYVLFDLDETVYAKELGLMDLIDQRINLYMTRHLGIDPEGVGALRRKYYQLYGTTGRGLHLNHELDVEDYYEFVHALPVRCLRLILDSTECSMRWIRRRRYSQTPQPAMRGEYSVPSRWRDTSAAS